MAKSKKAEKLTSKELEGIKELQQNIDNKNSIIATLKNDLANCDCSKL